jgi:putative transcriptional regulator
VIRYRLRELLADKAFNEGRTVTMEEVSRSTGLHRMTLSRMANIRGYTTRTDVLDKLCAYFSCRLEQLAEYVPQDNAGKPNGSD